MAICSFNCAVTTMMVGYVLYTFWTVRSSNHPDGVLHPPFSCYWVGNKAAIFTIKWCSSAQLYGLVAPRIELVDPITGLEKESIGQLWPVRRKRIDGVEAFCDRPPPSSHHSTSPLLQIRA